MHLFFILCLATLPLTMASPRLPEKNFQGATTRVTTNIAKPNCQTQCGSLTVQYPFGIGVGSGCSIDEGFDITCDSSYNPPKPFIKSRNIEIYNISDSEMRITNTIAWMCYDQSGNATGDNTTSISLENTTFTLSEKNKFTVIGCDDFAFITGTDDVLSGVCIGLCTEADDVSDGQCSGIGCCQTPIKKRLRSFTITLDTSENHTGVWSFNPCGYAFLGEEGSFDFRGARDLSNSSDFVNRIESSVPVVLDWVIGGNRSCAEATECKRNSFCIDADGGGYRCSCNKGYEGNPYLDPGCQDIDECEDQIKNSCNDYCINTPGSYNCTCPRGYFGDARIRDGCLLLPKKSKLMLILSTSAVFGMLAILTGIMGICFGIRKRKLTKLREKFFELNGGVFLKQKIEAQGSGDVVTIFSTEQLQKATDNYSQVRILGRGGYGVVYKGILSDKRVVAIKKSKLVDGTQAEQFINEVLILSQVIHRNVVKLLGCCLEEKVPILVYEFVSNNTLFHHIHHISGGMSWLSWGNRLRVAAEVAGALGYLHSEANMSIIHRDVKSTNILLDDNYTAKISDFGASRLVPLDHDQVTTLVQGTLGYLDPEYFHTSQLTDKSDVYSFGVVLAELITGRKPLCAERMDDEKNLATYFVKSMKLNRFFEIVEPRVLREGTLEQLQATAELVKRCLNLKGDDRPTMKEVAMELEGLRKFTNHPWVQQQTHEETRSLILEVEQSDLYSVPLIPYSTNELESYSGSTHMAFQENKPR